MSHQTGITANSGLKMAMTQAKEPKSKVRAMKIIIDEEQLCLDYQETISHSLEKDWKKMLPSCLKDNQPCYILMRMDPPPGGPATSVPSNNWVLISYTPETASIKNKMLAAATRATLKTSFGVSHIIDELQACNKQEASVDAWNANVAQRNMPGPMSLVEAGLQQVHFEEREAQQRAMVARSLASQTLRGLAFPVDQSAEEKLTQLNQGVINYVQLSVDTLNEAIKLEKAENVNISHLASHVPKDKPRYHFYRHKHVHEGESCDLILFIYSMPSSGCSIKDRMLYSSCKGPFLDTVERFMGIHAHKKIEIDTSEELNEEMVMGSLHPTVMLHQPMFAKPKGPASASRGNRRQVVKPT